MSSESKRTETDMQALMVPSDFEFLEPGRPEIRYESDLPADVKEGIAPGLAAMHERQAQGGQPPWEIAWPDGTVEVVGEPGESEPAGS